MICPTLTTSADLAYRAGLIRSLSTPKGCDSSQSYRSRIARQPGHNPVFAKEERRCPDVGHNGRACDRNRSCAQTRKFGVFEGFAAVGGAVGGVGVGQPPRGRWSTQTRVYALHLGEAGLDLRQSKSGTCRMKQASASTNEWDRHKGFRRPTSLPTVAEVEQGIEIGF